jgi:thiamine-phosphate pyrophosphorylase
MRERGALRYVGRLHLLTDTTRQERYGHVDLAQLAIAGGAEVIQFREKRGSTRALIDTARALARVCRKGAVRLIVNDRLDVAIASDAGGVHLGLDDFPLGLARDLLGPDRVIGATAGTVEQAVAAMWAGADYVGVGPIYATSSKAEAGAPIGLNGLREVVRAVEIPVIAVGGITAERIAEVLATGAHGVAVIEAVVLDPDPTRATRALREAIEASGGGAPRER